LSLDWDYGYWYYLDLHGSTIPFPGKLGYNVFDTRMDRGGALTASFDPGLILTWKFLGKFGRVYEIYADSISFKVPGSFSYLGLPGSVSVRVLDDSFNTIRNLGTCSAYSNLSITSPVTINTHGYIEAIYSFLNNTSNTLKLGYSMSDFGIYLPCRHRRVFGYSKYGHLDGNATYVECIVPESGTFSAFGISPGVSENKPTPGTMTWYLYFNENGNWVLKQQGTLLVGRYYGIAIFLNPEIQVTKGSTLRITQKGVDWLTEHTYDETPKRCWAWNQKPIDSYNPSDFSMEINGVWWDAGAHPQNISFEGEATLPLFSKVKAIEACINRESTSYNYFRIVISPGVRIQPCTLGPFYAPNIGIPFYIGPYGEAPYKWFRFECSIPFQYFAYEVQESSDLVSWYEAGYNLRCDYTHRPFVGLGNIRFITEPTELLDYQSFLSVTIPYDKSSDNTVAVSINPLCLSEDIQNKLFVLTKYFGNQIIPAGVPSVTFGGSILIQQFTNTLPVSTITTISLAISDTINYNTVAITSIPINWSNITWYTVSPPSAWTIVDVPVTSPFTIYPNSLYAILWKTSGTNSMLQPMINRRSRDSWRDINQVNRLTNQSNTVNVNYSPGWAVYSSDGVNNYSDGMVYSNLESGIRAYIASLNWEKYRIVNPPEMIFNYVALYACKYGSPTGSLVVNYLVNGATIQSWSIPPDRFVVYPNYSDIILNTGDVHLPKLCTVEIEAIASIGTDGSNYYILSSPRAMGKEDLTFYGTLGQRIRIVSGSPTLYPLVDHSFRFANKFYQGEAELGNKMKVEIQEFFDSSNLIQIKRKEFQDYSSCLNIAARIVSPYSQNVCVLFLVKLLRKLLEKLNQVRNRVQKETSSANFLRQLVRRVSTSFINILSRVRTLLQSTFLLKVLRYSSLQTWSSIRSLRSNLIRTLNLVRNRIERYSSSLFGILKKVIQTSSTINQVRMLKDKFIVSLNILKTAKFQSLVSEYLLKQLRTLTISLLHPIRKLSQQVSVSKFKLLRLISNLQGFSHIVKNLKERAIGLLYPLKRIVKQSTSTVYKLAWMVANLLRSINTLRILTSKWFLSNFNVKILKQNILKGIFNLRNLISRFSAISSKVLKLVSIAEISLFSLKSIRTKLMDLTHSLKVLVRNSISILHKLAGIVTNLLKSVNTLRVITLGRLSSNFNIKILKARVLSVISYLRGSISKLLVSTFKISKLVARIFSSVYSFKLLRERILELRFLLRQLTSRALSALFRLEGIVSRILSGPYLVKNLKANLISTLHFLKVRVSKSFGMFHSVKVLVTRMFSGIHKLNELVTKLIVSLSKILYFVPRIVEIKYNTRLSISRILSSKFGIGAIISRILSFIYSFIGFMIVSVTANPSRVIRTGPETVQLRGDFHDEADLDPSLYECKFWVRDETGNIYGPYFGTVVKKDSKEYYATYDLDPTETFLLGYYDIRVEVTKYG